jgi:peptidoglycan-associated lipoprotein
MRVRINFTFVLLLTIAAVSARPVLAQSVSEGQQPKRAELGLTYTYLRANAPPGGCGCFNMNGGSATLAWTPASGGTLALVGDITVAHAGAISSSGYSLTLSSYTVGERYQPRIGHSRFQPFLQVLGGAAHSSGTLVEGQTPAAVNAGASFAATLGGGLNLRTTHRFSYRLIEADYLFTSFDNGGDNHQNNLRLSTGVVLHF